jgi:hypothetical protein
MLSLVVVVVVVVLVLLVVFSLQSRVASVVISGCMCGGRSWNNFVLFFVLLPVLQVLLVLLVLPLLPLLPLLLVLVPELSGRRRGCLLCMLRLCPCPCP